MTEILEVLPLSPVREWAILRSFISRSHEADLRLRQLARQQHRRHRNHIARRLPRPAAGGRAIGIERLDFVADPDRFAEIFGTPGDANAYLIGFIGARGEPGAMQG